jgi:hypothetical protein
MAREAKVTMTLDELTSALSGAYGEELRTLVLYGSAARDNGMTKGSDYNVLVIVRSLTPTALRASAPAVHRWNAAGNPAPLVLTEAEWKSSRDIFAIEVADIQERHRVLAGALPEGPSDVDAAHLRHQLEFEAMGKLLRFRQALLACEGDQAREIELLVATKSAVLVLFRTLLRVHGERAPDLAADVVERAAVLAGLDAAPFLDVVTHASGGPAIPLARADAVVEAYHLGLKQLVAHVDALAHPA